MAVIFSSKFGKTEVVAERNIAVWPGDQSVLVAQENVARLDTGWYRVEPDGMLTFPDSSAVSPEPGSKLVLKDYQGRYKFSFYF